VSLIVGISVVVACVVAFVVVGYQDVAILVASAVLVIGIIFADPMLLVVLALPATILMARVGGILSLSDFVLAAATLVALVLYRAHGMRSMSSVLWAGTFYLATALPTVILNPYAANGIEFAHEVMLVLGSMVVGYSIGREGRSRQAVGIYIVGCLAIAVAAVIMGVYGLATTGEFGPVYLPGLDKNLIGGLTASAIIILYARPVWFTIDSRATWAAIVVCGFGMLASGARQAMIGAVIGLVVVSLRKRPETGRRPKLVWLVGAPVVFYVLVMVNEQLSSDNPFNSANQRLDWYAQTIDIWLTSPVFGVGLRWWYTSRFGVNFQPPNAEFEVGSSVGLVGLIGFLAMFVVAIVALWRMNPAYGLAGAAIVASRFGAAQFDLYWVAGQASFLWIIAALCYGARDRDREAGVSTTGADARRALSSSASGYRLA